MAPCEEPISLLPHRHTAVQCVSLPFPSFDLTSRLQALSYLKVQPGEVFAGGKNAYKCKQSHLKAAEDMAHTLLSWGGVRCFFFQKTPHEKPCLNTHPGPGPWLTGSWKSAWCCPTGRWAVGEASDYLQDSNNTRSQELEKDFGNLIDLFFACP